MKNLVFAISITLTTVTGAHAQQQTAGVMPVYGTNLDAGELAAIGALLAVAYSEQAGAQVLGPDQTGPALAEQASRPEAAKALGLTHYIDVHAVRLSQRVTVHATLRDSNGGHLFSVKTTAMSLDDMEPVTERIAASLYRRTPLEYTQTHHNVTAKEARVPNRTFAEKVYGVRTGVVLPFGSGVSAIPAILLQFDGRLEGTSYFFEFAGGFMLPHDFDRMDDDGFGGLVGKVGGSYYLTDSNIAPYIGAELSPRIMFGAYHNGALAAGAQLGIMFMRQSSSRIYVELGIDQNVLPVSRDYDSVWNSSTGTYDDVGGADDVYPTEVSLAVGVGW